jgi:hypothetical protein
MNGYEFIDYKQKIIKALGESQPIVELLTNQVGINIKTKDLVDTQIFSYNRVPDVSGEALNYIVVSTRVSKIENNIIHNMETSIYIFVPYINMKLPSEFGRFGNRLDNLIYEVVKLFSNERLFGIGKINLLPNEPVIPAKNHDGFKIRFMTTDIR